MRPYLILLALMLAQPAQGQPPGILSIDITTLPGEDYSQALDIARQAQAHTTSLSLAWDDFEPDGTYAPQTDWPAIANSYYPGAGFSLTLTFSVIDTNHDRRPADLNRLPWNDPTLIARFQTHLSDVLQRMPDIDLRAIAIGNEVDATLATSDDIAAFAEFLHAARSHIHHLRPGVPVATKLTAAALLTDPTRWAPILAAGDAVFATYYPLGPDFVARPPDAPATDLPRMVNAASGKKLYLLEAGYPSAGCTTTPQDQAAFYRSLWTTWQSQSDAIPLISLSWLTDLSPDETATYSGYYGLNQGCFTGYLSSIGLRDAMGQAKPALTFLLSKP